MTGRIIGTTGRRLIPGGLRGTFTAVNPEAAWILFANANGLVAADRVDFIEIASDELPFTGTPAATTTGAPSSLLTNLVSYWKLGDAQGRPRSDSVNGGNLIEYATPVASGPGILTGAAVFSGTATNYLQAPDSATLRVGAGSFTLACWFNVTSWGGTPILIRKENGTTMNAGYRLDIPASAGPRLQVLNSGSVGSVASTAQPALGMWHLLIAWFDSVAGTLNLQLDNGTLTSAATTGTAVDAADPLVIGGGVALGGFTGSLCELGLWKGTLTAAQRATLWNGGVGISLPFSNVP